jgi:signal peptidase I
MLLFQPFTIPSASMEPNLYEGDYIVVSKWSYGYSRHSSPADPADLRAGSSAGRRHRGDIVVFKLPRDNKTDYIKRVIGLPGDKIQMIANKLYINDAPVKTPWSRHRGSRRLGRMRSHRGYRETLPNGKSFITKDFGPNDNELDNTDVYVVPRATIS